MAISPYIAGLRRRVGTDLLLVPAATVLAVDGLGRVLLVRQSDTGMWSTVGGAIEPDETPEQAARREAMEEAGVDVELLGVRAVLGGPQFKMEYPNGDVTSYVAVVFDARVAAGVPRPDGDETVEVGWFAPADLEDPEVSDYTRNLLAAARWPG